MVPWTIAAFSSGVPATRLPDPNFGRSERVTVIENRPLLSKIREPFGPTPKGSLIFESNGRFSITVTRSDLPKFGSGSRVAGTRGAVRDVVGICLAQSPVR